MTLLQQARLLDSAISDLNLVAMSQLLGLWAGGTNFGAVFTGFQPLIKPLLTAGAMVTAAWYNQQAHRGRYVAEPLYDIPDERIDANVHWALFSPGEAHLERLAGTTERMLRDSSRQTVIANVGREKGARWVRFANAGCCEFCAVLATRGPVYHTEANALRGHDWCKCGAICVRPGGLPWVAPDYYDVFEMEYVAARTGIEKGDSLARDLGIAGEVPTLGGERAPSTKGQDNVAKYMRAVRAGRQAEPTAPQVLKAAKKPELRSVDVITREWNDARPYMQARPTEKSAHTKAYREIWGKGEYPMVVEDYLDGVGYMLDKYPQIQALAEAKGIELSVGSVEHKPNTAAWMRSGGYRPAPNGPGVAATYARVEYARGFMPAGTPPASGIYTDWTQRYEFKLADGRTHEAHMTFLAKRGKFNTHQNTSHHEMGHLMDVLTGWDTSRTMVQNKLLPAFIDDYAIPNPIAGKDPKTLSHKQIKEHGEWLVRRDSDFMSWLYDNQSRYSFVTAEQEAAGQGRLGEINKVEMLAEAISDVEANGDKASRPSKLIHEYLIDEMDIQIPLHKGKPVKGKGGKRAA